MPSVWRRGRGGNDSELALAAVRWSSSAAIARRMRSRYSSAKRSSASTSEVRASRLAPSWAISVSMRRRSVSAIRRAVDSASLTIAWALASASPVSCWARAWASATASSAARWARISVRWITSVSGTGTGAGTGAGAATGVGAGAGTGARSGSRRGAGAEADPAESRSWRMRIWCSRCSIVAAARSRSSSTSSRW